MLHGGIDVALSLVSPFLYWAHSRLSMVFTTRPSDYLQCRFLVHPHHQLGELAGLSVLAHHHADCLWGPRASMSALRAGPREDTSAVAVPTLIAQRPCTETMGPLVRGRGATILSLLEASARRPRPVLCREAPTRPVPAHPSGSDHGTRLARSCPLRRHQAATLPRRRHQALYRARAVRPSRPPGKAPGLSRHWRAAPSAGAAPTALSPVDPADLRKAPYFPCHRQPRTAPP